MALDVRTIFGGSLQQGVSIFFIIIGEIISFSLGMNEFGPETQFIYICRGHTIHLGRVRCSGKENHFVVVVVVVVLHCVFNSILLWCTGTHQRERAHIHTGTIIRSQKKDSCWTKDAMRGPPSSRPPVDISTTKITDISS
jgi:hypothetical protein